MMLKVVVSARALFDLDREARAFTPEDPTAFDQAMASSEPCAPGEAFSFVSKILQLSPPPQVIVLTEIRPGPLKRVQLSLDHYGMKAVTCQNLDSTEERVVARLKRIGDVDLYLTLNPLDCKRVLKAGIAAARFFPESSGKRDVNQDQTLKLAFDFDGVIACDESEKYYQEHKNLAEYFSRESKEKGNPLRLGPLGPLAKKLAQMDREIVKLYLVTARSNQATLRSCVTLDAHDIHMDGLCFGLDKLAALQAIGGVDLFFDDTPKHIQNTHLQVPAAHVNDGVMNSPLPDSPVKKLKGDNGTVCAPPNDPGPSVNPEDVLASL